MTAVDENQPQPAPPPSNRVKVRRLAKRADYGPDTIKGILDAGMVAHVAVATPDGPLCLPMIYARVGETMYLHGALGNATLKAATAGVCATVTIVDALVMAKSAFHHSMNYRCVVVRGEGRPVTDPEEKELAFRALVNHNTPGRSDEVRGANASELRQTTVVALPLTEASAKVRSGPPVDDEPDLELDHWAGLIPVSVVTGEPEPYVQPREG